MINNIHVLTLFSSYHNFNKCVYELNQSRPSLTSHTAITGRNISSEPTWKRNTMFRICLLVIKVMVQMLILDKLISPSASHFMSHSWQNLAGFITQHHVRSYELWGFSKYFFIYNLNIFLKIIFFPIHDPFQRHRFGAGSSGAFPSMQWIKSIQAAWIGSSLVGQNIRFRPAGGYANQFSLQAF